MLDPTKEAALYQAKQLRAMGKTEPEIAAILKGAGASPKVISEAVTLKQEPKPKPLLDLEDKRAILEGCISWMGSVGVRANQAAGRFPDMGAIRNEANNWQRKLQGLL